MVRFAFSVIFRLIKGGTLKYLLTIINITLDTYVFLYNNFFTMALYIQTKGLHVSELEVKDILHTFYSHFVNLKALSYNESYFAFNSLFCLHRLRLGYLWL